MKYFYRLMIIFLLFELGLQAESYFSTTKKVKEETKGAYKVMIFGDCVSMFYPKFLKDFFASENINIIIYDDIAFHDMSKSKAHDRKEYIKKINPDLIISMNGLFEVNKRSSQYGFDSSGNHNILLNLKTYSILHKYYFDYLTSEGQVKRIAQNFISNPSPENEKKLQTYLAAHADDINDNYIRAFEAWKFYLRTNGQEKTNVKIMNPDVLFKTIKNKEKLIMKLANHFDDEKFRMLILQLIPTYWMYKTYFWPATMSEAEAEIKEFETMLQLKDLFGFEVVKLMHYMIPITKGRIQAASSYGFVEDLLTRFANDSSPLFQLTSKACKESEKVYKSDLDCRLDVFDLRIKATEFFEYLKFAPVSNERKLAYEKLKKIYSPVIPEFDFENKSLNPQISVSSFFETERYHDDLVNFVKENGYALILAQYPTFKFSFMEKYNSPPNKIFVFDTMEMLKKTEMWQDSLESYQSSIYNTGKLTFKGNKVFAVLLKDFIVSNKILHSPAY